MKNEASNKILAFALVAAMLLTLLPGVTVYAEEGVDSGNPPPAAQLITAFDALPEGVTSQTVPLGTSTSALSLPDALGATVDGAPDKVPVDEWESAPEYDGDTVGTYIFTAVIPDTYTVADSTQPPIITVTVDTETETQNATPAVTITIAEGENGSTALYLLKGVPVNEPDLLAGVSAADENGAPVTVTVKDAGGLDMNDPQRPDGPPNPNIPYTITYAASHPVTEEVFTATREAYVTAGIMPLAIAGPFNIETSGGGYYYDTGNKILSIGSGNFTISMAAPGATTYDNRIIVTGGVTANITLDGVNIDVSGTSQACAFEITGGSTVNLTLQGTNNLISGEHRAGLEVPDNNTLTVSVNR